MDDFNIANLQESKNEWCVRLLNILTPAIHDGIRSIFQSSRKLCIENREPDKYLLTFQNLLTRIPQWNPELISTEVARILQSSSCSYLEELITCVHIIQLKLLTYARVGLKYKKIDIAIPKLPDFIHKVYINSARAFYRQAFLFRTDISPIDIQKNNIAIMNIIKECIMQSVRDSIPLDTIVKSYLDETHETFDEITEEELAAEPHLNKLYAGGVPSKIIDIDASKTPIPIIPNEAIKNITSKPQQFLEIDTKLNPTKIPIFDYSNKDTTSQSSEPISEHISNVSNTEIKWTPETAIVPTGYNFSTPDFVLHDHDFDTNVDGTDILDCIEL
jgi:hypothetical protein